MRSNLRGKVVRTGLILCLAAAFGSAAQSQTMVEPATKPEANVSPMATPADATATAQKARLGPGDLVEVSVYGVSDYKQEVRVNDAGDVSLPLVGAVHVAGLTIEEAQQTIAKQLVDGGYFRDPHVIVFAKESSSQSVSIFGEIGHPGLYPLVGGRRLYDMISAAGGFTSKAGTLVTVTHRGRENDPIKLTVSQDPAKAAEANIEINPGDTIMVSKAGLIYVVGDVGRPGGYVMENTGHITVLQAVALAQGVNKTAALNAARIIRKTPNGPTEVKIPLKTILAAKSSDLELQPEDILFVPGSAAKNAARRGVESIVQIATTLAIYHP